MRKYVGYPGATGWFFITIIFFNINLVVFKRESYLHEARDQRINCSIYRVTPLHHPLLPVRKHSNTQDTVSPFMDLTGILCSFVL